MKLVIEVNRYNGAAELVDPSPDVAAFVSEVVSYDDRQFVPSLRSYRSRRVSMVDRNGKFPPGCLPFLEKLANEEGHELRVVDRRVRPKVEPNFAVWDDFPEDLTPFAFQREAVRKCFAETMGIVKADVGAGKTLCLAMLVAAEPIKWVVLVHRDNLVADISAAFTAIGIEHATHTSKRRKIAQVTVANFSSCTKPEHLRALMAGVQGLIVDEAHGAAAATRATVLEAASSAYYRFGFSGSGPTDRSDSRGIVVVGHLGNTIYKINTQELEGLGRIVPASVKMVEFYHKPNKKLEYAAIYREVIVMNRARNNLIVEMVRRAAKPCMVFVQNKDHLSLLVRALRTDSEDPERVTYAWGDTVGELRKEVVEGMRNGTYDVAVCSVVFQEGVNIPNLRSVVLASAGKATISTTQRLGRGTRATKGKTEFELWDIQDVGIEMFYRQSQVRVRTYRKRGYEPRFMSQGDLLAA